MASSNESLDDFPKPDIKHGKFRLPWKFGANQSRPHVLTFLWKSYKEESRARIPSKKVCDKLIMLLAYVYVCVYIVVLCIMLR